MDAIKCIGNCFLMFLIAVVFDVLGVILLLIGIFANLRINGLFYGDFLIYTGSLIIFISLACWLMWYVGNVQVSVDDGCKKRNSIVQLARKLSERKLHHLSSG
uniref:Transmembrane protein 238 like n=2 Tax=Haplochromini TaxID=319058 RepID=A0A3B4FUE5_9CICH